MPTLNLGILAHVDAGKTSLTERVLHTAGVIDAVGRVDDGSTQTDSLELERRRGITIRSAVASFAIGGTTVNVIDTPGHPDFIAEVERALRVLDGAVLVVSAVEGVQAQTRVLMRALRRLGVPTLVFVNKIDRAGADPARVRREIARRLTPSVVALDQTDAAGTAHARSAPRTGADPALATDLLDLLTDGDEELLADFVADETSVPLSRLYDSLAVQTRRGRCHPVFFGSAITGAGVERLMAAVVELLPTAGGGASEPLSGTVFKVERGAGGEKHAWLRLWSGTLRPRDVVPFGDGATGRVTAVEVADRGTGARRSVLTAGQIGRVRGLETIRIGDTVGDARAPRTDTSHFAPPTLETVVTPVRPSAKGAMRTALGLLAEQDPLIGLRQDDVRQEISLSLYGEVQKEVIQATLAEEFGVDVAFRETTTICQERVVGTGAAHEVIDKEPNPFLATVGLSVAPGSPGSGVEFRLGVELGSMPYAFFVAVERSVRETLRQGLYGWEVGDCVVTMTHSGYWPRQSHAHGTFDKSMSSTAGDFRLLTPLVLADALRRAGTEVHEPLHRFRLELSQDALTALLPVLGGLGATAVTPVRSGAALALEGEVPAARVHLFQRRLPSLTRGEGLLETEFARYRPVRGRPPRRPRTDLDPLNRDAYLLRTVRRVGL
ncbi:GTP-binding protein [Streptomyces sp. NPDC057638]|uniref:GTP-binding protein n=1 Tax=Streptomyces sp. NPDC057638 TaxID=3346190 RepID=UPI00369B84B0